jgi:hypothetical protein
MLCANLTWTGPVHHSPYDREGGEAKAAASLFVPALRASSYYTFAHATLSQDLAN